MGQEVYKMKNFRDYIVVNEENNYKGLNLDGLKDEKEIKVVKAVADVLIMYNKKEWDSLDAQGKHDIVMKFIKKAYENLK